MLAIGRRAALFGAAATLASVPRFAPAARAASAKSAKRGIAYDIADAADLDVLGPGVSWWYNWAAVPNNGVSTTIGAAAGLEYDPMLWNGDFDADSVVAFLQNNPAIDHMLVLNEPNVGGQAYTTPQDAATLWPQYEAVAARTGVRIVGPQITWGTMPDYQNPTDWLDAFLDAYANNNGGAVPQIDCLGFHWYDYGLADQLDALDKYNKPIWVTEFANWHSGDSAAITTLAEQEQQMTDMVSTCETRADVERYAWFTGRLSPDPHFSSLLSGDGQLTALGQLYLSLPVGS